MSQEEVEESSEDEDIESSGDDDDGDDEDGAPMDADGQQVRAQACRRLSTWVATAECIAAGLAPGSGCYG